MHSSFELSKSLEPSVGETFSADLRLIEPVSKRSTAASFRRVVVLCEATADFLTVMLAVTLGCFAYNHLELGRRVHYPTQGVVGLAFTLAMVMVLMLDRAGSYNYGNSLLRVRETEQVLRVSAQGFLLVLTVSFLGSVLFSRWLLILCSTLVPLALFLQKTVMYLLVRALHSRGYGIEKVLIYGSGSTGRRVLSVLNRSPKLGLEPVAFVDDDPAKVGRMVFEMGYEPRRSAPVVEGPLSRELVNRYGVDLVIIAIPSIEHGKLTRMIKDAFDAKTRVSFVPSHFLLFDPWIDYQDIDGVLLVSLGRSARRAAYEIFKRAFDVLGSLVLLVLGMPLFLLLALVIKIDSPRAVMFRQERIGRNGRLFKMYKFRTMLSSTPQYDYSPISSSDPRITRVGRFLRRTSLDELPQLLNVLLGDMSLVGPRPEMPFIVEQYSEKHRQRLLVKPGLTGLWQLSGDRAFLIHENLEYDLYYIQHRNFFMDLAILLHTSIFAMRGV